MKIAMQTLDCSRFFVGYHAPCRLLCRHYGWAFASPDDPPFEPPSGYGKVPSDGAIPDPLHGAKFVRDIYDMAVPPGTLEKFTVPVLWDNKVRVILLPPA